MFSFSMPELIVILVIALVVFGPGKLPEVGKALGRSLEEFKRASSGEPKKEDATVVKAEVVGEKKPEEKQTNEEKK